MANRKKAVTLKMLSDLLQLDVSTISRVLNGPEDTANLAASTETIERIRMLAHTLNYHPNPHATSLKTQRSQLIGVLVPRLSDIVLATIYEGIDEIAMKNNIFTFVSNTQDSLLSQSKLGEMMIARKVDGLIIGDAHTTSNNQFLKDLKKREIPFVLVSRKSGNYCSVTCNDYLGGQLAAAHFIEQGHTHFAVIAGERFASTGIYRTQGFVDYCQSKDINIPKQNIIRGHFDAIAGHKAGLALFLNKNRPSAVFAVNDFLAIGLMGAAREFNLLPGRDIAIIGFNDISLARELPISLSSIRSPMREMGENAMTLLLDILKGGNAKSIILEPELIIRESSQTLI